MKKTTTKILAFFIALLCALSVYGITAFAATIDAKAPERYAKIPSTTYSGESITNCGGISIGKVANKMFVVKAGENENNAMLFYFPNMDNPSNKYIYIIEDCGHANAMAIDSDYIYITAWIDSNSSNDHGNELIRIPKNYIYNHATARFGDAASTIPVIQEKPYGNTNGYNRLSVVIKKHDGTYPDYTGDIRAIAFYSTNTFIVNYSKLNTETTNRVFTKARIQTVDGVKKLVLGRSTDDVFIIKKNWTSADPVYQDIGYNAPNGFFLPVWYGRNTTANTNRNPKKTVIAWADIDHPTSANSDTETINGNVYTRIIPDKIVVNVSGLQYEGVNIYNKFEPESIAFDDDKKMYASVNVEHTTAYLNLVSDNLKGDGVYIIKRNNNTNFLL